MRILILEDEPFQLATLVKFAKEINSKVEIIGVKSIEEAKNIVKIYKFDAFFLDVNLPDGNGVDFAKIIRSKEKYACIPMLFLTANKTSKMDAFIDVGYCEYIIKPYETKALQEKFRKIIVDYFDVQDEREYIDLKYKDTINRVRYDDIVFIEVNDRKIFVTTKTEVIEHKKMTLRNFLKGLRKKYTQVSRTVAINENFLKQINYADDSLILEYLDKEVCMGETFKIDFYKKVAN